MTNKAPLHANPSKNRTPRHRAREFALQGLYQWLLNNEDVGAIEAHIREAHGFDKADAAHFDALLYGAIKDVEAFLIRAVNLQNVIHNMSRKRRNGYRSSVTKCNITRTRLHRRLLPQ